jgi:hypothetical protein
VTRKDYVALAKAMADTRRTVEAVATDVGLKGITKTAGVESLNAVLDDLTRAVARVLADDNPNFTYTRFMHAAGAAFLREKDPK